MELTWIAIAASLLMGSGALLVFVWAVRRNQFREFEAVKYQVFWSDMQDLIATADSTQQKKEQRDGNGTNGEACGRTD